MGHNVFLGGGGWGRISVLLGVRDCSKLNPVQYQGKLMMQIRESGENPNFRPNFVPQYFCEFYLYWLNIVPNWLNIG